MLKSHSRKLILFFALAPLLLLSALAHAQEAATRTRKYTPPPPTAKITVSVIKDANGKPIENAAVIFHMTGDEGKGNMELKTNEEGKAAIEVVPIGDTMTLQIIASGFQTFGEDYKISSDSKDIVVRLKRPGRQYSTYEHAAASGTSSSGSAPGGRPKPGDTQPTAKQ